MIASVGPRSVGIGDVICVRNHTGLGGKLIRLGAALLDKPNTVNHIAIVHHVDLNGTWWGIEGRPGGVGYAPLTSILADNYTVSNVNQPKTEEQRFQIAKASELMLGVPYDWVGIGLDGLEAFNAPMWWAPTKKWGSAEKPPSHVVCSSLADWVYDKIGLASPGKKFDRTVTPADWEEFDIENGWEGPQ